MRLARTYRTGAQPIKTTYARQMRKAPTPAEGLMWEQLRCLRFMGWRFRHQHVIAGWIVDFWCPAHRLVVEVDGAYHSDPEQATLDNHRDQTMARLGIRVVRITNEQVFANLPDALARIAAVGGSPSPADLIRASRAHVTKLSAE